MQINSNFFMNTEPAIKEMAKKWETSANNVQKENHQTNEKHTAEQAIKLSISDEGMEYYRNHIQQGRQENYDDVVQRKELSASKKNSDIDYGYEIQKRAAQQNQNADTERSTLNITDKANSYVKAYAELYDEIVKGYENGTREIYVADENGPRKLTQDEELSNLDAAYKKTVDDFVTMESTNQHARRIIGEEMDKISKITSKSALASAYIEEQNTRGKDEIPENLTEKMYGASHDDNVNDYSKYLQGKYSYMNTGTVSMQGIPTTVSVSSAFLMLYLK